MSEQEILKKIDQMGQKIEKLLTEKNEVEQKAINALRNEAFEWNRINVKAQLEKNRFLEEQAEEMKRTICQKYAISVPDLIAIVERRETHDAEGQRVSGNDN